MRKFQVLSALIVLGLASASWASISGSKHDFGKYAWSKNQICLPCHTPHNAILKDLSNQPIINGPMWNHTLSNATYTLYVDDQGVGQTGAVDQNSKLCLSCHDGTVAVDSFGGLNGTNQMTGGVLGTDLSSSHPIGEAAVYPQGASYMVDPALRSAAGIMPLRKLVTTKGLQDVVGCTSCHEPHNRKGTEHMLWVNNSGPTTTVDGRAVDGSGLCLNCHKK